MIFLDTNIVSALMRPEDDPVMANFMKAHPLQDFFLPSIVAAEIRYGIRRLPVGKRREGIERDFLRLLEAGFGARIVAFDASCAAGYAMARRAREEAGRGVTMADALIGGMALAHGAALATRNVQDFDGYGLTLLNPWEAGPD